MPTNTPAPPPPVEVIRSQDWYGQDVSARRYTRYAFIDVDMTEVTNEGAVFDHCTFRGVRFNVSQHTAAAFTNCTFSHCVFFDTRFTDCKLVGSLFQQCTFSLFQVSGGDWSFVGLPGADLRRASLRSVRMREADLTGARLEDANVTETDLSGAQLHSANFIRCDLRGSDLSSLDPLTAELGRATVSLEQAAVLVTALGLNVA
ncbi:MULTISPECIES: pentapeptide repeat-containing protein [Streptomyces violaceusniger group]|uniref:Pentapeptide repeat-containing protein n=2 Tax=Streptomyces rhizosphaericus TaxID=114699 RepID=A0ABN1SBJ9_9ACTN|nr:MULTISPECIES: pentapeptide repeat-containing protein [Streptomyces violaceusniger group]